MTHARYLLLVLGLLVWMSAQTADCFDGARWIGAAAETCPDADLGDARWIAPLDGTNTVFERRFVLKEKPRSAELVWLAREKYAITINGRSRMEGAHRDLKPTGAFHNHEACAREYIQLYERMLDRPLVQ